jgi:hypothetical protein
MSSFSRTSVVLAATVVLLMTSVQAVSAAEVLSATPATIAGATLAVTTPTAASPKGVSPDVYFDETTGTYYLYTTYRPSGTYTSTDGTNWTAVAGATLPDGFDWSMVKMGPSDYRMYYGAINPNSPSVVRCTTMKKELRYATSTDLVRWTTQPGAIFSDVGCGVPHVLRKPDGTYLMYYNTITTQHGIHIATSNDGLNWTALSGPILNNQELVDPAPIVMPDGTYLMVASTGGAGGAQELQLLSSPDGINWTLRSTDLYAPAGVSVLDPSVEIVNGQIRVWFGYAPGMDHTNSQIASGILTLGSASAASTSSSTAGKPGTTCTKVGAKTKFQGKTVVCKKSKGKLIWVRAA